MLGRKRLAAAIAASALLPPILSGCGPEGVGTIEAPKDAQRSQGPTVNPNLPGGGTAAGPRGVTSTIPTEDISTSKPPGRR